MADATAVRVGYKGSVLVAPTATTAPTDPFVAWAVGWEDMGYVSDDGLTQSFSQDITDFMAWGQTNAPVRSQVTSEEVTFSLTFIETSKDVLSVFYGLASTAFTDTVAVVGPPAKPAYSKFTKVAPTTPDERSLGIDIVDGAMLRRIIVPRVQVTDRGDLVYKSDELVGYQVTFKALLASDGTTFTQYTTHLT